MKAEIKRYNLWDDHLQSFYPDDPKYFYGMIDMDIGLASSEGGDIFQLMVCTPKWFQENVLTTTPSEPTHEVVHRLAFGRHYLFVKEFDEAEIEKEVRKMVTNVRGKDWNQIALRLSRYFRWEFEDYDDFSGIPSSF